jgi:dephospho-CoA kinase
MIRLGLTGSIGMGKSTTAGLFRLLGVPVYDADRAVHRLLAPGGAGVSPILAAFPDAGDSAGGIDRQALGGLVFAHPAALYRLEAILHPLVRHAESRFLAAALRRRLPLVVLDVPLLFETGGERRCDAVAVVSAPYFLQRQRVLARPGMTDATLAGILARQTPDQVKRRRADAVIRTGIGRRPALRQILSLLNRLRRNSRY